MFERLKEGNILWQMSLAEKIILEKVIMALPSKKNVIEIGSYHGGCTNFLSKHFNTVHSVDISYKHFKPMHKNIVKHEGISYLLVPELLKKKPELIIVDGDHEYEGVKKDLEAIATHIKFDTVILVHDAAYAPSKKAVQEFAELKLPGFTTDIDFQPGVPMGNIMVGGFSLIEFSIQDYRICKNLTKM